MSNTESMVERVARALAEQWASHMDLSAKDYADRRWKGYKNAAKAAIEAMREPNKAMLDAGRPLLTLPESIGVIYEIMIDAALREGNDGIDD